MEAAKGSGLQSVHIDQQERYDAKDKDTLFDVIYLLWSILQTGR